MVSQKGATHVIPSKIVVDHPVRLQVPNCDGDTKFDDIIDECVTIDLLYIHAVAYPRI